MNWNYFIKAYSIKNIFHLHWGVLQIMKIVFCLLLYMDMFVISKGPHNIYELYETGVWVERSSNKHLSSIYCRRKSHGPIQSKRIVSYKYCHRRARIKDVLDIPKQWHTDLHDTKRLVTFFPNHFEKNVVPLQSKSVTPSQVKNWVSSIIVVIPSHS